ncbi:MAG: endonuclease III domain-containing protein [bacterium]|nr:endonuclease III domain-containing protein [bacterium]
MKNPKIKLIYDKLYSAFGPQHWWPGDSPFEVIVGAILTQNTAWKNVSVSIQNLKNNKVLTPRELYDLPLEKLGSLIRSSGYYNLKAKRLNNFLNILFSGYEGDLGKMLDQEGKTLRNVLLDISGIGPETADSIMLYAGGKLSFVVDAYTRRIFSRHKLIEEGLPYDELKHFIEKNLPGNLKLYNEYHALIVRTGKEFCSNKDPKCSLCPIREI